MNVRYERDFFDRNAGRFTVGDGCWEWCKPRPDGYGSFHARGVEVLAHRWMYEEMVGPIDTGLELDHLCRNRACIRPDHLEPVTSHENWRRGESPSARNARATVCKNGHELTDANVYVRNVGGRTCRKCQTQWTTEWRRRRRAGEPARRETPWMKRRDDGS